MLNNLIYPIFSPTKLLHFFEIIRVIAYHLGIINLTSGITDLYTSEILTSRGSSYR